MSYDIDDMSTIHAEINGQIKNNVAHCISVDEVVQATEARYRSDGDEDYV